MFAKYSLSVYFLTLLIFGLSASGAGQNDTLQKETRKTKVYTFHIKEEIAPPVWRTTQMAFNRAAELEADLILIQMNTYGGMVDMADSIRTKILNSSIPVYVFINNNAASAGALISIACDSIYMVKGANIGAATVVNQTGEVVPDKFQSYMRAMMRSTAEAKGRNPEIAQAMVDPSIYVPGVSDSGKVLTLTTSEAIRHGFAEAQAETIEEVLKRAGHEPYEIIEHQLSSLDRVINFLIKPVVSGILIMLIIGGLYFELQTPGVGFPLAAAVTAAILYFAPLYLEGLASHWEIVVFVVGVILLMIEIFALPGFGVAGITGLILMVGSLSFAMVESFDLSGSNPVDLSPLIQAFFTVIIAVFFAIAGSLYLSRKLFTSSRLGHLALQHVQDANAGYTTASTDYSGMIGKSGTAHTILRPSGKVDIEGELYDATLITGFAEEGEQVEVVSYHTGQLFVRKKS
ncbi:MAG: nodulation protein NfeD [Bacteroidetes bacterium]|nr:nodulation protein NfeD [Bacteroidota bacterium]